MNRPPVSLVSLPATPGTLAGPRVDLLDYVGVLLVHDVALDLQRRRQLTGLLGQVVVEDLEALDLLDRSDVGVDLVDRALDLLPHPLVPGERGRVRGLDAELLRERRGLLRIE